MRRKRVGRSLSGQILFVESEAGAVTVDCLLASDGEPESIMCTMTFRLPKRVTAAVVGVLAGWELNHAVVTVAMEDGPRGAQVEISSGEERLVLQPCD